MPARRKTLVELAVVGRGFRARRHADRLLDPLLADPTLRAVQERYRAERVPERRREIALEFERAVRAAGPPEEVGLPVSPEVELGSTDDDPRADLDDRIDQLDRLLKVHKARHTWHLAGEEKGGGGVGELAEIARLELVLHNLKAFRRVRDITLGL